MPFVPRPRFDWSLRTRTVALGRRTIIMGILNVTPDSFSDGRQFYSPHHPPPRRHLPPRGRPKDCPKLPSLAPEEVLPLVLTALGARVEAASTAGIPSNKIVLDPGFGFGKRLDENYPLLGHFDQLQQLNLPLLAGVSRKGFLAHTLSQHPSLAVLLKGASPSIAD